MTSPGIGANGHRAEDAPLDRSRYRRVLLQLCALPRVVRSPFRVWGGAASTTSHSNMGAERCLGESAQARY